MAGIWTKRRRCAHRTERPQLQGATHLGIAPQALERGIQRGGKCSSQAQAHSRRQRAGSAKRIRVGDICEILKSGGVRHALADFLRIFGTESPASLLHLDFTSAARPPHDNHRTNCVEGLLAWFRTCQISKLHISCMFNSRDVRFGACRILCSLHRYWTIALP